MKKIINGKVYNTETATLIARASSDYDGSNLKWWSEDLYKTPRGNWFISGVGNAMSRWNTRYDNMRGPGEGIEVLTESDALEWCERNGIKASIIEANFTVEEG